MGPLDPYDDASYAIGRYCRSASFGAVKFSLCFMYEYMLSQPQSPPAEPAEIPLIEFQASISAEDGLTRYIAFIADEPPSI